MLKNWCNTLKTFIKPGTTSSVPPLQVQSLALGEAPESWKRSHVFPVPKSGDLSLISNYRPIALHSNIDKAFERIVFKHFYNHLHENSILTSYQSGFTPGDSTTNQLTILYDTFVTH